MFPKPFATSPPQVDFLQHYDKKDKERQIKHFLLVLCLSDKEWDFAAVLYCQRKEHELQSVISTQFLELPLDNFDSDPTHFNLTDSVGL